MSKKDYPPKLLQLQLPITLKDKRISSKKSYLAKIEGEWYAGKFSKQWYGWNFEAVYDAGCQVDWDGWEAVFEVQEVK